MWNRFSFRWLGIFCVCVSFSLSFTILRYTHATFCVSGYGVCSPKLIRNYYYITQDCWCAASRICWCCWEPGAQDKPADCTVALQWPVLYNLLPHLERRFCFVDCEKHTRARHNRKHKKDRKITYSVCTHGTRGVERDDWLCRRTFVSFLRRPNKR